MSWEINWFVVGLRVVEGALYGTGFVLALVIWYGFIARIAKAGKAKGGAVKTNSKEDGVGL